MDHSEYVSPFSWRYGSKEMRVVWSEKNKRHIMRRVWVALAEAQNEAGVVTDDQLEDLKNHVLDVDIKSSIALEEQTKHDVVAEIMAFAMQCPTGGGVLHWGATSTDITDNTDVLRIREALTIIIEHLEELLLHFRGQIDLFAGLPVIGYTHIQPAELTTLGYRLSVYAQDLSHNLIALRELRENLKGKGFKGAVGSQGSYVELLKDSDVDAEEMEFIAMELLHLSYFPIATQTYTRQQDLLVINALSSLAASLNKFALDFRIMQSPAIGEWSEPFSENQVGSSAMPFKRNPIISENICSLARYVGSLPSIAWDNAGQSVLERSLDDSANRRIYLPNAFLACEEILIKANKLVFGMQIDRVAIARNINRVLPIANTERLLVALVGFGLDRQRAHKLIQRSCEEYESYTEKRSGLLEFILIRYLREEKNVSKLITEEFLISIIYDTSVGTVEKRAAEFAKRLSAIIY